MTTPWWQLRANRLIEAVARLRSRDTVTVVESIFSCKIEDDIPGLRVIQCDDPWTEYFADPANAADLFLNQGYDHDLPRLWRITQTGRASVTAC